MAISVLHIYSYDNLSYLPSHQQHNCLWTAYLYKYVHKRGVIFITTLAGEIFLRNWLISPFSYNILKKSIYAALTLQTISPNNVILKKITERRHYLKVVIWIIFKFNSDVFVSFGGNVYFRMLRYGFIMTL